MPASTGKKCRSTGKQERDSVIKAEARMSEQSCVHNCQTEAVDALQLSTGQIGYAKQSRLGQSLNRISRDFDPA